MSNISVNQIEGQGGDLNLDKDTILQVDSKLILPKWTTTKNSARYGIGSLGYDEENQTISVITPEIIRKS